MKIWIGMGCYFSTLIADPFGLIEVNGVHVMLEIRAVCEGLLAQWTFWHELWVIVGEHGLEVDGSNAICIVIRHHLRHLWLNFHSTLDEIIAAASSTLTCQFLNCTCIVRAQWWYFHNVLCAKTNRVRALCCEL